MAPRDINMPPTQWNPFDLLQLDVAELGYSIKCHGKTQKGVRCANPVGRVWHEDIRIANQKLAARPLNQITQHDLIPLANALLCRHWHTGTQGPQLAAQWWRILEAQSRQAPSINQQEEMNDLYVALLAAQQDAAASRGLLQQTTEELRQTQVRLAAQSTSSTRLRQQNEELRIELRAIEDARDVALAELRRQMQSSSAALIDKAQQHERDMSSLNQLHEERQEEAQKEISEVRNNLRETTGQKESLERENQLQRLTVTRLKDAVATQVEKAKRLNMTLHFSTLRHHLQNRMWERQVDGLRADNETLMEQQRYLQEAASGYSEDLHALQTTLSPLKLENVRKGLHTVFSVRPLSIRALRISTDRQPS